MNTERANIFLREDYKYRQMIEHILVQYLITPEGLLKFEAKENLKDAIEEYLYTVPHENKFFFPETAQILHRSVKEIENFSAYQTTAAWSALAAYAGNLYVQPWRKEFKEIKTYSGFYKHNIEAGLVGVEVFLELMGYRPNGNGSMKLSGPIDKRRVLKVTQDSFTALVECQILRTIWESLVKVGGCSWINVLHYRETHICSPEEAASDLYNHMSQYYYRDVMYPKYAIHQNVGCPANYGYHSHIPPHPMYIQGTQPMYGSYISQPSHYSVCSPNGYYPTHHHSSYETIPSSKQMSYPVPIATLIEVDPSPSSNSGSHKRSTSDVKERRQYDDYYNKAKAKEEFFDNWKHPPNKSTNSIYSKTDDLPDLQSNFTESLNLNNVTSKQLIEPSCSKSDISTARKKPRDQVDSTMWDNSSKTPQENVVSKPEKDTPVWACLSCTFHNLEPSKVCEMCNKSRTQGNETEPLISGGSECPNCTLVNERGLEKCKVCQVCLKNSPTYI